MGGGLSRDGGAGAPTAEADGGIKRHVSPPPGTSDSSSRSDWPLPVTCSPASCTRGEAWLELLLPGRPPRVNARALFLASPAYFRRPPGQMQRELLQPTLLTPILRNYSDSWS